MARQREVKVAVPIEIVGRAVWIDLTSPQDPDFGGKYAITIELEDDRDLDDVRDKIRETLTSFKAGKGRLGFNPVKVLDEDNEYNPGGIMFTAKNAKIPKCRFVVERGDMVKVSGGLWFSDFVGDNGDRIRGVNCYLWDVENLEEHRRAAKKGKASRVRRRMDDFDDEEEEKEPIRTKGRNRRDEPDEEEEEEPRRTRGRRRPKLSNDRSKKPTAEDRKTEARWSDDDIPF